MQHGLRSASNWRYRIMKKYKRRAEKFLERSESLEEKKAWLNVIKWFDAIINRKRFTNPNGAIGIPQDEIEE